MSVPIEAVRAAIGAGARKSATVLSVFGGAWLLAAGSALGAGWLAAAGVSAASVVIVLLLAARRVPDVAPREPRRALRGYAVANVAQALCIAAGVVLLGRQDLPAFIPGWVGLVVAAHFLPFAAWFSWRGYAWLSLVGSLVAVVGLALAGAGATPTTVLGVVGGGFGLALWTSAAVIVRRSRFLPDPG